MSFRTLSYLQNETKYIILKNCAIPYFLICHTIFFATRNQKTTHPTNACHCEVGETILIFYKSN